MSLALVILLAAACVPTVAEPSAPPAASIDPDAAIWASLEARPLNLPSLTSGRPCPRTSGKDINMNLGPGLGNGPLYPVGLGVDGVLSFGGTPEGGWYFAKVLWVASPDFTGHALIRGHQIDGPNELRFENGSDPSPHLHFDGSPLGDGWRHQPSYTRLRAPGCYAYQVDGIGLNRVIVFEAILEKSGG
jgi:hypothetical protein